MGPAAFTGSLPRPSRVLARTSRQRRPPPTVEWVRRSGSLDPTLMEYPVSEEVGHRLVGLSCLADRESRGHLFGVVEEAVHGLAFMLLGRPR